MLSQHARRRLPTAETSESDGHARRRESAGETERGAARHVQAGLGAPTQATGLGPSGERERPRPEPGHRAPSPASENQQSRIFCFIYINASHALSFSTVTHTSHTQTKSRSTQLKTRGHRHHSDHRLCDTRRNTRRTQRSKHAARTHADSDTHNIWCTTARAPSLVASPHAHAMLLPHTTHRSRLQLEISPAQHTQTTLCLPDCSRARARSHADTPPPPLPWHTSRRLFSLLLERFTSS